MVTHIEMCTEERMENPQEAIKRIHLERKNLDRLINAARTGDLETMRSLEGVIPFDDENDEEETALSVARKNNQRDVID